MDGNELFVCCISIHAPPRGATIAIHVSRRFEAFQFTPLREGRHGRTAHKFPSFKFQFTPLREGRLQRRARDVPVVVISIHAPPRGATWTTLTICRFTRNFNSRPSARGDKLILNVYKCCCHFNSRPSARGDGKRYAISANLLFNPYKSAWLNNSATQFVEIILVIFHRIIA